MQPLTEKYRPRVPDDLIGQPDIAEQIKLYLTDPYSHAFIFEGATGTGKTSAAFVLARGLGVDVEQGGFGGFYEIASGEQTGESVRAMMDKMKTSCWSGSGWRFLIVNEADAMSPNASYVWLDVLEPENLPPKCTIVFTTNAAHRLPARLRDRCERLYFESGWTILMPYIQPFVDRVWKAETGEDTAPAYEDFGAVQDDNGDVSFRRILQLMSPWVRAKRRPPVGGKPAPPAPEPKLRRARPPAPPAPPPAGGLTARQIAARKAWVTIRARQAAQNGHNAA